MRPPNSQPRAQHHIWNLLPSASHRCAHRTRPNAPAPARAIRARLRTPAFGDMVARSGTGNDQESPCDRHAGPDMHCSAQGRAQSQGKAAQAPLAVAHNNQANITAGRAVRRPMPVQCHKPWRMLSPRRPQVTLAIRRHPPRQHIHGAGKLAARLVPALQQKCRVLVGQPAPR